MTEPPRQEPDHEGAHEPDHEVAHEPAHEDGRRATNLELFLDLVFVFGVAQVSVAFGEHLTWPAFGKGVILLWLLWWLWSQFAWLGTAIDLQGRTGSIVAILIAVAPALVVAAAIPEAFGARGAQFAVGYLLVQSWSLGIQGLALWPDPVTRRAWFNYAPLASLVPVLVVVGGFAGHGARPAIWLVASFVNAVSAVLGGRTRGGGHWHIDPAHFAERHSLFVIIVLGEVLVAIGVAVTTVDLTATIGLGFLAAVLVAGAMWWSYFGFVAEATEQALRRTAVEARATLARDAFTFGHFPLVLGITLYADVARHVVPRPGEVMGAADRVALLGGLALLAGGFVVLRWRLERVITRPRIVALLVLVVVAMGVGPHVPGWTTLGLAGLALTGMQVAIGRSARRRAVPAVPGAADAGF
jgi:low temperature requirement protein LtrA